MSVYLSVVYDHLVETNFSQYKNEDTQKVVKFVNLLSNFYYNIFESITFNDIL